MANGFCMMVYRLDLYFRERIKVRCSFLDGLVSQEPCHLLDFGS